MVSVNQKGMSKEEKLGIVAGAVAFIVVLLFFLVLGNASDSQLPQLQAPAPAPAQQQLPAPPVPAPQGPANVAVYPLGDVLMIIGVVLLILVLLYLAHKFGWLRLERVSEPHDSPPQLALTDSVLSAPKSNQVHQVQDTPLVRDEIELQREQLEDKKQKLSELTRQLHRRQETIQRLASERNKVTQELQAIRSSLRLDKETSLTDGIQALVTEVRELRELPKWEEIPLADLEAFWPTLQLDKKPFMSKRRQERLLARMRAENMKWMRAAPR